MDIDIDRKKAELLNLWSDLFSVCRSLVDDFQSGNATLRGTLLKELNAFLRESARIIESLEELETKRKMEEMYVRECDGVTGDVPRDDADESSGDFSSSLPFPSFPDLPVHRGDLR